MMSSKTDQATAARTDPIAHRFAELLRDRLGDHVRRIELFGSRARGDAHEGSDYDVLVIVDERTPELRSAILDIEVEMLDRHEALMACIVRSQGEWSAMQGHPVARNVAREGVRL
jgi:predicted nucleotidyltransferase